MHPSKTDFAFCDVFWGALYANMGRGGAEIRISL